HPTGSGGALGGGTMPIPTPLLSWVARPGPLRAKRAWGEQGLRTSGGSVLGLLTCHRPAPAAPSLSSPQPARCLARGSELGVSQGAHRSCQLSQRRTPLCSPGAPEARGRPVLRCWRVLALGMSQAPQTWALHLGALLHGREHAARLRAWGFPG